MNFMAKLENVATRPPTVMFSPEKFASYWHSVDAGYPSFARVEGMTARGPRIQAVAAPSLDALPPEWRTPYLELRNALWEEMLPQSVAEQTHFEDFVFTQFLHRLATRFELQAMESLLSGRNDLEHASATQRLEFAAKYVAALDTRNAAALREFRRLQSQRSPSAEPYDFAYFAY